MKAAEMKKRPAFSLMKQTDVQNVYPMQMPRWLFSDPRYAGMSLDATFAASSILILPPPAPSQAVRLRCCFWQGCMTCGACETIRCLGCMAGSVPGGRTGRAAADPGGEYLALAADRAVSADSRYPAAQCTAVSDQVRPANYRRTVSTHPAPFRRPRTVWQTALRSMLLQHDLYRWFCKSGRNGLGCGPLAS